MCENDGGDTTSRFLKDGKEKGGRWTGIGIPDPDTCNALAHPTSSLFVLLEGSVGRVD